MFYFLGAGCAFIVLIYEVTVLLNCVVRVVGISPRYIQSPRPILLLSRSPLGRAVLKPAMWDKIFILDCIPSSMVEILK